MTAAIVGIVIAVFVVLVLLSWMQSSSNKEAVADLQREIAETHIPDILELVYQEVDDAGLRDLPGSTDVDPTVLLKVWKRDGADCPIGQGEFQIAEGVQPSEATEDDVTFECGEEVGPETPDARR
jgi:hypothetical protein